MTTFVLIHGAWHGAWCWHKTTPLLEAAGHRVIAPDLPSMGKDVTPASVITLDYWSRFVADLIARESDPVVLVGHSRGGIVISQAAELVPGRIHRLVYLAGFMLRAGETLAASANQDTDSLVPPNMIPAASGVTCVVRSSVLRDTFYGDCSDADFEFARDHLTPEPLKPLVTPLQLTDARYGRVPRAYIETAHDRAVTPAAQKCMQAASPCERVFTLDTDHSPFLCQPGSLARILISI
jgi:pimeloyl-ACP methyl ester carboxylesterase